MLFNFFEFGLFYAVLEKSKKTIDVTKYTNHEDFTMPNNDIVILELAEEVDLATYTPACLAKSSDTTTFDGKTALVYGETSS